MFQVPPITHYLTNRMGMTTKYSWMLSRTLSRKAELNKVPVGDGQKGWAAIKKKAEESTAAKNAAQCKMKYLSNIRIDDGSWRGTNKGFLDR
jgi:hypothetical protein